jgi:hypothetical protein
MKEIFKDIPEYEGFYQISNLGNVKSLSRNYLNKGKYNSISKEKILKHCKDTCGYYFVGLCKNGKVKNFTIHKLVAMAFLGHVPDGTNKIVVDHINNIKTDNRLENLQLLSNRENCSKDRKVASSQYVGVYLNNKNNKWRSRIQINGKSIHLGYFSNELDAYQAYQKKLNKFIEN